jgi:predicted TIM-barrel fold metal-dependent hydrolase
MLRVDCQSHVFPSAYAEIIRRNTGFVQAQEKDGTYVISYGDLMTYTLNPRVYDPKQKLNDMDDAGIDIGILSTNIPGPECLLPELGIEGSRVINNYIAELCTKYPGRFYGLASLPLRDVSSAMAELERAVQELDLRGIVLYSHINGKSVDSPEFEPLYNQAEKLQIPLVLHPMVPTWGEVIKQYSMIPMIGLMIDTSIAMLRLILSGTLERHPDLLVVHPHCGGVLPYLMPRIEEQTEVKRRGRENIKASPMEYYRRVYMDLVSPSALAMQYALDFSDADHLLFGSDHPWVSIETFVEHFNLLRSVTDKDAAKILGLNACKLFKIK